jgi:hypothetical protein
LVEEIIQISVVRVVTIMDKLHNHHFKPTIIFKILKDMHLLMLPPPRRNLEETLHAFIKKQETINTQHSTLNMLKP